ncbi:putative methyl-accepting chemotaxis protein, partial [Vibrio harveyi]
RTFIQFVVNKS